ncbi:carbon-nitrogen hydrolase family protein [Fusibacter bizertensis]|uniref:Carbon-nitrogen hydrolase family protein n=1 Tax=Fusibacter bizertensis TaxID=1488331 RepID=A0ABT6NH54_9FIRM|nr:carbon-nitrogen hydrolase family protein [Fusibacter bizertensis]MDH8679736.1 carbon-nitrogen hydrolase family protein [Fusibacter bizertensis]
MKIAVVNFNSKKNVDHNIAKMKKYIFEAINSNVDFIIFPELCLTGYQHYMNNPYVFSKVKFEQVVEEFIKIASKYRITICFGSPYFENDKVYNAAIVISTDKTVKGYKKIHLYGIEHKLFSKGTNPVILETVFGKIGFGICYDTISFPELIRYYAHNGVNLYVNLSAIQLSTIKESKDYIKRALEYHVQSNGIYIASSNVSGTQNREKFLGGSCVVGPDHLNEIPVHYYCNSKLSMKSELFIAEVNLNENLRFIFDGNRFNKIPDFNIDLYRSWYT